MGYTNGGIPAESEQLAVTILGERRDCRILKGPLVDPSGARMRA